MRIAVIGGNLLGCATVANLALVQEIDHRKGRSSEKHKVTLFAKESRLGASDFRTVTVDGTPVEVGRYSTLPLIDGTYLKDLVDLGRGAVGHFSIWNRRIKIPGDTRITRGDPTAFSIVQPWVTGSYRRLIRSFATWDWDADCYHHIHKGWSIFDLLHRILNNEIWRAVAVAGFVWSLRRCLAFDTFAQRGQGLVLVAIMFTFVALSPAGMVALWQKTYSFWGSTIPALVVHGLTAGISRGSVLGFVKQLAENNFRNRATCAPSIGVLLARTGLGPYVRGSGGDYVTKFKYDPTFVIRYIAPTVSTDYPNNNSLAEVNSLACHLAQFNADFSNSDIATRRSVLRPGNNSLCDALIAATAPSTDVDVRLNTAVKNIAFDDSTSLYSLTTENGTEMQFDGVVLAECPSPETFAAQSPRSTELAELLAYDRCFDERPTGPGSHMAVVLGVANAGFFRFSTEKNIPDLVQVIGSPSFSRVERVRDVGRKNERGIYVVHCGADFQNSGLFNEMFESGSTIAFFEPRPSVPYSTSSICGEGGDIDDIVPPIVLGMRFVYAAASYRVAVHPEMDAMSALNVASLFSKVVNWESALGAEHEDDKDEENEEEEVKKLQSRENVTVGPGFPEDED